MKTDQITLCKAHSNFQARLLFNLDSRHYRKNELTFRISWMVLDSATQDNCKYSTIYMTRYHGSGLLQTRQKISCVSAETRNSVEVFEFSVPYKGSVFLSKKIGLFQAFCRLETSHYASFFRYCNCTFNDFSQQTNW